VNRIVRSGLALGFGLGFTLAAIAVADRGDPASVPPGTFLGGVDFGTYCREEYGTAAAARLNPSQGAFGWRCWTTTNDIIAYRDIDMHDVCARKYGEPVFEQSDDVNDPNSWRCRRGPRPD